MHAEMAVTHLERHTPGAEHSHLVLVDSHLVLVDSLAVVRIQAGHIPVEEAEQGRHLGEDTHHQGEGGVHLVGRHHLECEPHGLDLQGCMKAQIYI